MVTELLSRGAKIDAATKKGNTALHIASLAGQVLLKLHQIEKHNDIIVIAYQLNLSFCQNFRMPLLKSWLSMTHLSMYNLKMGSRLSIWQHKKIMMK